MSRIFERGYSLILSEKYRVIRIVSSYMFVTIYPAMIYLLTRSIFLTVVLPLLYSLYAGLLFLCYRLLLSNGFGRSKFASSLSISTASLGSLGDFILTLIFRKLIAIVSVLAFTGVHLSVFQISSKNEDNLRRALKIVGLLASILPSQYLASLVTGVSFNFYLITDSVVYATSFLSINVMVRYVEKLSSSYMLELLRSMLEAFGDRVYSFENALLKICRKVKTYVHMLLLEREDSKKVLILVPYLHFGPISGTEGSRLLHDLINLIRNETNIDVLYMHGVGSHELDVVGRESRDHVLEQCVKEAKRLVQLPESVGTSTDSRSCPPQRICGKLVDVLKIPIGNVSFLIISRLVNASDDIPLRVYRRVMQRIIMKRGPIIFVDAQNSYEGDSAWTEDEIRELVSITRKLCQPCVRRCRILASWRVISQQEAIIPEIGPLGIHMLALRYVDHERQITTLLVIFDSNNMKRDLRNILIKHLREKYNVDYVEVLTMDDHELVKFVSGRGYTVLGEYTDPEKIISLLDKHIPELLSDLREVKRITYKRVVINPKVFSEEGFEYVKEKLLNCIRNYRKIAALVILVPLVALLLTVAALC